MTEEEKKEFEEFLKWKKEKAEQVEDEQPDVTPQNSQNGEGAPQDFVNESNKKVPNSSGISNGVIWMLVVFAIIFLLFVYLGSSNKTNNYTSEKSLVVLDSDAVVIDEPLVIDEPYVKKAEWNFTTEQDEMTDSKNIWASITSDNYISQDFPYEGETRATITVRYMKKYGYDVLVKISQGQINGSSYNGTDYVTARFDDNAPKKYYFDESSDGDSKVIFIRNHSDFIKNCKKAKEIKIDLPLYQGGRPLFRFHVDEPLTWKE